MIALQVFELARVTPGPKHTRRVLGSLATSSCPPPCIMVALKCEVTKMSNPQERFQRQRDAIRQEEINRILANTAGPIPDPPKYVHIIPAKYLPKPHGSIINVKTERYRQYRRDMLAKGLDPDKAHPTARRARYYKTQYGMRLSGYFGLLRQQEGKCAICGTASSIRSRTHQRQEPTLKPNLFVDHDHDGGALRGLLCHLCNAGLGMFRDNVAFLHTAAVYLERARPNPFAPVSPEIKRRKREERKVARGLARIERRTKKDQRIAGDLVGSPQMGAKIAGAAFDTGSSAEAPPFSDERDRQR
jgi:hypothetical protein